MFIDGKQLGTQACYVIGEAGHNHQGDVEVAAEMIRVAARCGADAVKFQVRDNRAVFTEAAYTAPYNSENAFGKTYGEHREALELSWADYIRLQAVARKAEVALFATAFDQSSVDFCVGMGFPAIKIASGDLTNTPLIANAVITGLPILLSTGGGTLEDVARAVQLVPREQLVLMQCTAIYPCPFDKLNLGVIDTYRQTFPEVVVGASLHDNGIASSVAAYTLGARVIEKHFTLDRTMKGTDQAFSLEPQGFQKMTRDLRRIEKALGDGSKALCEAERPALEKMAKSVVLTRSLAAGTRLARQDMECRSPGGGLPPYMLKELVGQVLSRDLRKEEPIGSGDLEASLDQAS